MRYRFPEFLAAAVVGTLFLALNAGAECCAGDCPSDGPHTISAHGVSFQYPGDWRRGETLGDRPQNELWTELAGKDDHNFLYLAAHQLTRAVNESDLNTNFAAIDAEIRDALTSKGARITKGAERTTLGGLPALVYEGTGQDRAGWLRWAYIFDGATAYYFHCQAEAAKASVVDKACQLAHSSFKKIQ